MKRIVAVIKKKKKFFDLRQISNQCSLIAVSLLRPEKQHELKTHMSKSMN